MRPDRPFFRLAFPLALALIVVSVRAWAAGPADPLLKLVPPDAAVTVAVEDLRGHAREFFASPLADGLRGLPAVKAWLASERFQGYKQAKAKVEVLLGADIATIRDGIFGEAVVLTMRFPPGVRPDEARGLLLARVSDHALLDRLIGGLNSASLKSGEVKRVTTRKYQGAAYQVREFGDPSRPSEYYAALDDRVFAWSNSEDSIQGVIDRQAAREDGLESVAAFRDVRRKLPGRALASLFIDPRFVERLIAASPRPKNSSEERLLTLIGRYLAAVRYVGAALEWKDGVVLHAEEAVDPSRLPVELVRWADRTDRPDASLRRVPPSAFAMATLHTDPAALVDTVLSLAADSDRPKIETFFIVLNGLFGGSDVRTNVLPKLGPGVLAYVEKPDAESKVGKIPAVFVVETGPGWKAAPIDNALRTLLAVYSLDAKNGGGRLQVEDRNVEVGTVTALSETTPYAYAIKDNHLVLGNTVGSVQRALVALNAVESGKRVERVRSAFFPEALTFACADLRAIHEFAAGRRSEIARNMADRQKRPVADAARDLDEALALIDLFDAAFLSSTIEPGFTGVHQTLGLVKVRPPRP